MFRTLVVIAATAIAVPAAAATYAGKPAAPTVDAKFVSRDIIWHLAGGRYQGSTNESRPLVICQSLAKRAGRLESFTVDGRAFADADLAKCNAVAPPPPATALAEAK
jgi:hypothetical protein